MLYALEILEDMRYVLFCMPKVILYLLLCILAAVEVKDCMLRMLEVLDVPEVPGSDALCTSL